MRYKHQQPHPERWDRRIVGHPPQGSAQAQASCIWALVLAICLHPPALSTSSYPSSGPGLGLKEAKWTLRAQRLSRASLLVIQVLQLSSDVTSSKKPSVNPVHPGLLGCPSWPSAPVKLHCTSLLTGACAPGGLGTSHHPLLPAGPHGC